MKILVKIYSRAAFLAFFSIGYVFLSACKATSESVPVAWSAPVFAGIPDSQQLSELSGITRSNIHPSIYWVINDGPNQADTDAVKASKNMIYAIDAKANTVASIEAADVRNFDWEDISNYQVGGKNYLAVSDAGDNGGIRTDLYIHIFEEPTTLKAHMIVKPLRSIRFRWKDGARDTEAIIADASNRVFYLISKKRVPAELYALPFDAKDGDNPKLIAKLEGIQQPDSKTMNSKGDYGRYRSQVTAADISPDGETLAVLNYQQINFFPLKSVLNNKLRPNATITLPWLPQSEAIAYSMDGRSIFVGGEQPPTPIVRFDRITH